MPVFLNPMSKTTIIVNISDGIQNKKTVKAFFDSLPDGRYLLTADSTKKRTLPQNAYLHGVLIPEFKNAIRNAGYDEMRSDEQAKQLMKQMFLKRSVTNINTGEVLEYVEDTHNLKTVEFNVLIEDVIKFCAETLNYIIHFPNEQMEMSL